MALRKLVVSYIGITFTITYEIVFEKEFINSQFEKISEKRLYPSWSEKVSQS